MIEWDDKYKTGDAMIDSQHKMLFDFFNDLEIVIKDGRGASFIQQSLDFIEDYIHCHFGLEEICMFKHRCPIAGKNKIAHENFKEILVKLKEDFEVTGFSNDFASKIHQYIEDWIKDHIMNIDTRLKDIIVIRHNLDLPPDERP